MHRLARFDVSRSFKTPRTQLASQLVFGAACAGAIVLLRTAIDMWAPTAGPFALVYLAVVVATLYGHWQAGAVAYLLSFLWAWWYVLPVSRSFRFEVASDPSRVVINALSVLVVLVLAESFRRAVAEIAQWREAEIERRGLLLQELEHRTKNNFALVVSLLELQKRRAHNDETREALDQALARVHTFASAYTNLATSQGEGSDVNMRDYLNEVVTRVSAGVFDNNVKVSVTAKDCTFPRQRAVAIGLFINEALTNCSKYAFPDGRGGNVEIVLSGEGEAWELSVRDNGADGGHQQTAAGSVRSGLGTSLMTAFAQQAEAEYVQEHSLSGRRVALRKLAA